jgi:hypothetical protein
MMMNILRILLAATVCALTWPVVAQDTNSLKTRIGTFEARAGVVIVKGINPVGTIPLGAAELSVGCKQTRDLASGEKMYGFIIEVEGPKLTPESVLVDDDEAGPLLKAVRTLGKINNELTTLSGFAASYTTKAGLCVTAESVRKDGAVQNYLKIEPYPPLALTPVQMTQLANLLQEGRENLDVLKVGK